MRRILLVVALALSPALLFAGQGTGPDYPLKLWKSSATGTGNLFNSPFATAPVVIHAVIVDSPTTNQTGDSYFRVMKGTSVFYGGWVSTATSQGTNSSANSVILPGSLTAWDIHTSVSGSSSTAGSSFIDKRGGSSVYILWDWLDSSLAYSNNSLK